MSSNGELWYKERCPSCDTANWCHLSINEAEPDADGLRCWKCKHEWVEEEVCEMIGDDVPNIIDGQEAPK